MGEEAKIKIPRADENEVAIFLTGTLGNIEKKLKNINDLVLGINLVVILSLVAIIISVIGLFLDQMRYNNAAYKEYSSKLDSMEQMQQLNAELHDQNNKKQKIITAQQEEIQQLSNTKK